MVTNLLIKYAHKQPLTPATELHFSTNGIKDNVVTSPLRHVLILPNQICNQYALQPGALRENLIIDYPALHDLPSGTVLQIGEAQIRLTFHCEPCSRIKDKINLKMIQHKRGYLGQFLNTGVMHLGDKVKNLGGQHPPLPYAAKDRVHLYLRSLNNPVSVTELLFECGLSLPYARAIPAMIKHLPNPLKEKVIFKSHRQHSDHLLLPFSST